MTRFFVTLFVLLSLTPLLLLHVYTQGWRIKGLKFTLMYVSAGGRREGGEGGRQWGPPGIPELRVWPAPPGQWGAPVLPEPQVLRAWPGPPAQWRSQVPPVLPARPQLPVLRARPGQWGSQVPPELQVLRALPEGGGRVTQQPSGPHCTLSVTMPPLLPSLPFCFVSR